MDYTTYVSGEYCGYGYFISGACASELISEVKVFKKGIDEIIDAEAKKYKESLNSEQK
jgi:hypothetical protein